MDKVLSVVYADTYNDSWGSTIEVFGVADNKEDIEKICNLVQKKRILSTSRRSYIE